LNIESFRKQEFLRREKRLEHIRRHALVKKELNKSKLHIVYVMTHTGICGGTKIILQHANLLTEAGHKVSLVSHFEKPDWFPIDEGVEFLQIPFSIELAEGIPSCDLIVASYWREISECIARDMAPVIYFEQGDYHLFDPGRLSQRLKRYIEAQFMLADDVFTVSRGAACQIEKLYNRKAKVIHNGIDQSIFRRPDKKSSENAACADRPINLVTIGSENSKFKGLAGIKKALSILDERAVPYRFSWITADEPCERKGEVYVNPPQQTIADILASSDIYICNSKYESFSLPVLEAMTCGCSIITTPNAGIKEYCEDGKNCLMTKMDDPYDLADRIIQLYRDPYLRQSLTSCGYATAKRFDWESIVAELIQYYKEAAGYEPYREK